MKNARNVAILLAIAALVYLISNGERGGRAEVTFEAILWGAFGLGIGYLAIRLYREHRISLHSLGDRHRAMLYGAAALAVFDVAARKRMWQTGLGELLWFVLVGLVVWAALEVYRYSRTY
jgi:type IV secretory pathway TrbD component